MNTLIGFFAIVLVIAILYFIGWCFNRFDGDDNSPEINNILIGFGVSIILSIAGAFIVLIYMVCGVLGEIILNSFK